MAQPEAKLITSEQVDMINQPDHVGQEEAKQLMKVTPLRQGDLVYMPRGLVHRGLDGVLAQVITVPGFIPGAEIGVDHHLKAINDRLGLKWPHALPYNKEASLQAIVK